VFRIRNIFQLLGPRKLSLLKLFIRRDTPLKKTAIAVAVLLLAVSMVLPVVRSVNLSAGKCATIEGTLMADGSPIPPYPPTLVADGSPIPPYPPKPSMNAGTLVADGSPIQAYPPKPSSTNAGNLVADGSPIPPYPPTFVADGSPIPPYPPKGLETLVAA